MTTETWTNEKVAMPVIRFPVKIGVYDNSGSVWLHELRPLTGQHATNCGRYKRTTPRRCPPAVGKFFKVTTMIVTIIVYSYTE